MALTPQQKLGKNLISVGEKEIAMSEHLVAAATSLDQVAELMKTGSRVDTSMTSIEDGTRATRDLLSPVAAALHSVANQLDGIRVQHIAFETDTINIPTHGSVTYVSEITLSDSTPFRAVASGIEGVADNIDNIRQVLRDIADGIRDIHADLPNMRSHVRNSAKSGRSGAADLKTSGKLVASTGGLFYQ